MTLQIISQVMILYGENVTLVAFVQNSAFQVFDLATQIDFL